MSDTAVSQLPNLGSKSSQWLHNIGIHTLTDLQAIGVVEAYCLIKAQHEQASLNLLYALYGAAHNILWNQLTPEIKKQLQEEAAAFQFGGGADG
ncbi:MAG: TfoX/Sxy family protein [Ardenticatenaceae bacterium]|nr:TfoX/Sxy family protein [Ardenticatenaceae bacterium]